jgi:hypothetical protein
MILFLANGQTLAAQKHFEHGRKINVSLSCKRQALCGGPFG